MTAYFTGISACTRHSELPALLARVAERAVSLGVAAEDSLRLQLIVEELFVNTIAHGHQGESERLVSLSVDRRDDTLTLRYADDAPPFDNSEIGPDLPSTAAIGGQGLGLIHGMSKAVRYRRQGQFNVTEIDISCRAEC